MTPKSSRRSSTIKPFVLALLLVVAATLLLAFLPQPALAALDTDYYLANDINCSGFDYGDWKGFMPIGNWNHKFTGTFDGKGYKILGSKIKNVSLEEVDVSGKKYVGGLGRTESKQKFDVIKRQNLWER